MSQTFLLKPSYVKFNILVVDDDSTSLSIVSAKLRYWNYNVVKVTRPVEALSKIRIHQDIHLVITDLHMPGMNGLQLQKQINEEFSNLPVMIMSSDDRESVIMKALASGVVFYMVKPLNPVDIQNLWQYAFTSKKGKSIYIEESGSFNGAAGSSDDVDTALSVNRQKKNKKHSKRKTKKSGKRCEQQGENVIAAPKKSKLAWTNSLHNRFLHAIRFISLEKAVPKKILEFMNVPGLTRENVASHLQKYRMFLKQVAEKRAGVASKNFTHRSKFAAAHSAMMLKEAQEYAQLRENQHHMMRSSPYMPGYGGGISGLNCTINGSTGFPSLGASSSNSVSQLGLLGNQTNLHQSIFPNTTNPLYQADPATTFGAGSNDKRSNSWSGGGLSGGLMNGTNSNPMYQKKSQSRPDPYNDNIGASSFKGFGTSGWNPSDSYGLENLRTINSNPYSNYARMRQRRLNGTAGNEGVTTGQMGNATVHHLAPGESSSSAGFANANYQSPLTFAGAIEQENTSGVPPLSSQHQHGLGNNAQNEFTNFGLMNNANPSVVGYTAQPEQFDEYIDFSSLLFDPSDYQFLFEQQGGEGALNPNSASGSGTHQAQLNLPINQSQNPDLSGDVTNNAPDPWDEPSLEQLHEIEQLLSPELSSNAANAHPLNDYYPILSFDQNANQQQQSNQNIVNNSDELNGLMNPSENSLHETRVSDEEFIDSLLQDDPYWESGNPGRI